MQRKRRTKDQLHKAEIARLRRYYREKNREWRERCQWQSHTIGRMRWSSNWLRQQIIEWAAAYPVGTFPEPSEADWKKAAEVLKEAGLSLDAISASNMRHVVGGVAKIVTEGLDNLEK